MAKYAQRSTFIDLPRPYREGWMPKPVDDGTEYNGKIEQTKDYIR